MIKPTVGRVILFCPGAHFAGTRSSDGEPLPALISRVWGDTCINIGGFDADGKPFAATSVLLVQDDGPVPAGGHYAEWMSYQKDQAAKTEAQHEVKADPAGDQAIERMIHARNLTAPRVSPADLDANIVDTEIVKYVSRSGQVFRWAILTAECGYGAAGRPSVSVSPENDDDEIGERVAIANSRNEMWPLMGYALKQKLFETLE